MVGFPSGSAFCTATFVCGSVGGGAYVIVVEGESDITYMVHIHVFKQMYLLYMHAHSHTHTQITLNPAIAVFLTHTRDPPSSPPWPLPPTVSPFLRTFSLPTPDPTVVFRAHCMALGLKASKVLANKLTNLQTMARDQL